MKTHTLHMSSSIEKNENIFWDLQLSDMLYYSIDHLKDDTCFVDILRYLYTDTYKPSRNQNVWYSFAKHQWTISDPHNMITDISMYYDKIIQHYKDKKGCKRIVKKCDKIIEKIKNQKFCNKMILSLRFFKFDGRYIEDSLDKQPYLIGFNNGIYDMESYEFRSGRPTDYVSMSVGYDYKPEHTKHYAELLQFLEDIQPNEEERHYMLTLCSMSLIGKQIEIFHIWKGTGCNGKSTMAKLLEQTFGEYHSSVPAKMVCRKNISPWKEQDNLFELSNKRSIIFEKPQRAKQTLNTTFIRHYFTKNNEPLIKVSHRKECVSFKSSFVMSLLCDDTCKLIIRPNLLRACGYLRFNTKFVENPENIGEKKINIHMKDKLINWTHDMMLLLIEKHKQYDLFGLGPTESMKNDVCSGYIYL